MWLKFNSFDLLKLPISLWLELRLLVIIAVKRDQFRGKNSFLESLHIYVTTYGHMTTWQQFCLSTHVKFLPEWNFQDWKRRLDKENLTLGARNDFTSCHYYVKFVVLFEIQEHKLCTVMLVELFCCARLQKPSVVPANNICWFVAFGARNKGQ